MENDNNKYFKIGLISLAGCTPFFLGLFTIFIAVFLVLGLFESDGSSNDSSSSRPIVDPNEQITVSSSGQYWWPIGGNEIEEIDGIKYATGEPTSTVISSKFSNSRTIEGVTKPHRGIDIGHNNKQTNYIIAAKEGTIYRINKSCDNNGYYGNKCGSGLGNYIILEHQDGIYTIYAHMAPNTIYLEKDDKVKQGQIIGEMGNSGSSTGTHLHFQIDVGGYDNNKAVDPLTYIDIENPRPKGASEKLIKMLQIFEGTGPTEGDYYIAYHGSADAADIITIGHGIVIKYNIEKFKARGFSDPINQITEGAKVKKSIVDDIKMELINEKRNRIVNELNNRGISLYEYQIDALTSRIYNLGNINGFYEAYLQYGNTQALYDNYLKNGTYANGVFVKGLEIRRKREWKLFSEGLYYGVDYT